MHSQHCSTGAIEVLVNGTIERKQHFLPAFPLIDVLTLQGAVVINESCLYLFRRLGPDSAKAKRNDKLTIACLQVDLAG